MSAVDPQMLALFRDEASERLDSIVDVLLAVERGQPPADALATLLRDAHTIKGAAGMMGLDGVYELAHALEDVLAAARARGILAPEAVAPLLRAADALRDAVHGDDDAAAVARDLAALRAEPGEPEALPERPAGGDGDAPPAPDRRRAMRVDPERVDRLLDVAGEAALQQRRLEHVVASRAVGEREEQVGELVERGADLLDELQDRVLELRMLPLSSVTAGLPRAVRDLAVGEGKQVDVTIEGADTHLDRNVVERIGDVLTHLLRNAVAHGVEPPDERRRLGKAGAGQVRVRAEQRGERVAIEVADDGRGIAPELLARARETGSLTDVLTAPGFSTAERVTAVAGRGVGLDSVRRDVEALGGEVEVASAPGAGTTVTLALPLTLALLHVMLVERAGSVLGIPLAAVSEALAVDAQVALGGRRAVAVRGEAVRLADVVALLGGAPAELPARPPAIVVEAGGRRVALLCDRILGNRSVLLKSLGALLGEGGGYLGGALLGDGRVALVPDPRELVRRAAERPAAVTQRPSAPAPAPPLAAPRTALVVDDQFTVRELQRSILEAAGYDVEVARDGQEALHLLSAGKDVDVVVTDIEMPELDGIELIESIRRDERLGSLPVVVVTSRGREEDERRGIEAGADAYIVKERFDQQALLDAVERLVGP